MIFIHFVFKLLGSSICCQFLLVPFQRICYDESGRNSVVNFLNVHRTARVFAPEEALSEKKVCNLMHFTFERLKSLQHSFLSHQIGFLLEFPINQHFQLNELVLGWPWKPLLDSLITNCFHRGNKVL